jgi:hypothetical protein
MPNQKDFYDEVIDNLEKVLQSIGTKLNALNADDPAALDAFFDLAIKARSLLELHEFFGRLRNEKKPKAWPVPKV